eukprot:CAMPEP_0119299392 /NCGR_PEP_ID=MMETSP1333-20130426/1469_1 /TAXON_ID=418940 /ORGANISM="Scyphosphaera apsteinii, Strain RCC1455" /LENGTH=544 /DNA_ID=CAMNT_0007300803 /DNA_START=41 /DNA_END=1672 /DNA_ORIENTATION=+
MTSMPPQQQQMPVPLPSNMVPYTVTIPDGAMPGQTLVVQAPDGNQQMVCIPPGVLPGQQMHVHMAPMPNNIVPMAAMPGLDQLGAAPQQNSGEQSQLGEGGESGKKRGRKSGTSVPRWNAEEEEKLKALVLELGDRAWKQIAERLGTGRSVSGLEQHWQIMVGKRKRNGSVVEGNEESEAAKSAKTAAKLEKEAAKAERELEKQKRAETKAAKKADKESKPAKAKTAYRLYCIATRDELVAEFPNEPSNGLQKKYSERWKLLGTDQKSEWEKKAEEDTARYISECEAAGIEPEPPKVKKPKLKAEPATGEKVATPSKKENEEDGEGEEEEEEPEPDPEDPEEAKPKSGLISFNSALSQEKCRVAKPPPAAMLAFKDPSGADLVGRKILYNWEGVGWCVGTITSRNLNKRNTVGGDPLNFFVHYQLDNDTSSHNLELEQYRSGPTAPENSWVLLEEVAAPAKIPAPVPAEIPAPVPAEIPAPEPSEAAAVADAPLADVPMADAPALTETPAAEPSAAEPSPAEPSPAEPSPAETAAEPAAEPAAE